VISRGKYESKSKGIFEQPINGEKIKELDK
jgi:hypothetical protein